MDSFSFLGIDINSPLNQAHSQERVAENFLRDKKYEQAIFHFEKAHQLMIQACELVPNSIKSLQLQAEKLQRMQKVVLIKQKEEESRLQSKSELSLQNAKSPELSSSEDSPSVTPSGHIDARWELVPQNFQHWLEDRDKDSLLPLHRIENTQKDASGRKMEVNPESKIEELEMLNNDLKCWILNLIEELEKTKKENRSLSQTVETLRSEVWSLTARLQDISLDEEEGIATESEGLHSIVFNDAITMQEHAGYDPMVSSLIVQPQSFFEFDGGNKTLIQSALDEEDKNVLLKQHEMRYLPDIRASPLSVRYEDVDEEIEIENCETGGMKSAKNCDTKTVCDVNNHAGLPPLSPAHNVISTNPRDDET